MRCKCCDSPGAMYWMDDFYCGQCRSSIADTIKEDSQPVEERINRDYVYTPPPAGTTDKDSR